MKKILLMMAVLLPAAVLAQPETFPVNDVQDDRAHAYAFTNATIYTDYQTKIENGTLLIREGKVVNAGRNLSVPEGYTVVDLAGKTIYPALIDMYTNYGMPKMERPGRGGFSGPEQIDPKTEGAYNANDAIRAHFSAAENFKMDKKTAVGMRKLGFGAVSAFMADGIARGTGALVTLGERSENEEILMAQAAAYWAFNRGSSSQNYPFSTMGMIALIRQTHLDLAWYAAQDPKPFADQTLDALMAQASLPQVFHARNWKDVLRADRTGDEFGVQYIIRSDGDAYQRIAEIKATGAALIVGVNFPDAMDVEDPIDAERVNLTDMKHWELAPTNLGVLEKNGIDFAITTQGLGPKNQKNFWKNLRSAVKHGLSKEKALQALTEAPARLLGAGSRIGKLQQGFEANFLVTSGDLFDEKTQIHENWIAGHNHRISDPNVKDRSGMYSLKVGDNSYQLKVTGKPGKHSMSIPGEEDKKTKVNGKIAGDLVTLSFTPEGTKGLVRLSGWIEQAAWQGVGEMPDGSKTSWRAERTGDAAEDDKKNGKDKKEGRGKKDNGKDEDLGKVVFPFTAYGSETQPQAQTILISNATVWTLEDQGTLTEADVLVRDGKIAAVGKGLRAPRGAVRVDGTGKHLTPGIIDEHSHIALDGTNDTATNSGMVRMGDVVDSEDVNVYRQLAGGVTAAQLLHGSANPIGGQSALIKFRWGKSPQEMLIENADGFIKFALGENVKRSRNNQSVRYPQTRMGVEQVYMDAFAAARDYQEAWQAYNALSDSQKANATAPRRDLALDAMAEILAGERFITCHSYVQSEINMLMKVAEHYNFRINTFTHILEGYKVADKMAAHGAGGSSFSDWWNYKWEVRYAIPYNPAIMKMAGVTVAVNSDSAEMARRLNQEAAKAVKYGGMSEEEALKTVTLNPAKLLHLDDRMGSIKEGKDADLVLWSDNPLSIYARAEKTLVDGIVYYDYQRDAQLRAWNVAERARLIQKMIDKKKGGAPTRPAMGRTKMELHCDTYAWEHVGGEE